ncbi:MAG: hypothetical protein HKN84_01885 [Gammaproteobacteria bacterium]|nr:hypothetical protein [Gammaproteobacteria bacterium]
MSRLVLAFFLVNVATSGSVMAADPPLGDPMRPYVPASPAAAGQRTARPLTLTGVLIAATRRIAVINGALYREGDTINGARIMRIESDSVQLRRGSEDVALQLERGIAIRRTNNGESAQ